MPKKTEPELSRAGWIRQQVLQNPNITLEQLQEAYNKTDYPKKDCPKVKQVLYQANNQIRKRWGVDPADIPRKPNGEINLSAMVRLYIDNFGDQGTPADCVAYFATDGLELGSTIFSQIKSKNTKQAVKPEQTESEESPDANQETGPRAGAPTKRRVKRRGGKRGKVVAEAGSHLDKYQEIESKLDKLIAEAEEMKAWPLAADLKNARRRAGAGILSHS